MASSPRLRQVRRLLLYPAALLLAGLLGALGWLMLADGAAQWLLPRLAGPDLQIAQVQGRLAGPLAIDRLVLEQDSQRITIDGLRVDWHPLALLHGEVHIVSLQARRLTLIRKIAQAPEPLRLPASLALPLRLRIDRVHVDGGDVDWGALNIVRLGGFDLQASYDGHQYRLELNRLAASGTQAGASATTRLQGQLTLAGRAPFALDASLAGSGDTRLESGALPTTGQLRLQGTLADITADVAFALGAARLHGKASLQPFADRPLQHADLRAQAIDLSALNKTWPQTALDGELHADATGGSTLDLSNTMAGPIDAQRLPVRALQLRLRQHDKELVLERVAARLGTQERAAGTLGGSGQYLHGALELGLDVSGLNLQGLDRRLQPTALAGRIDLQQREDGEALTLALSEPIGKKNAALDARLLIGNTRLSVDDATLRYAGARMTAKGHVQLDGSRDFAAEGDIRDLHAQALGRFDGLPALVLNGHFMLRGARSPALLADLDFRLDGSQLGGRPLRGEGRAMLRANRLHVPRLSLVAGENQLDIGGDLADGATTLDFALRAPKVAQLGPGFGGSVALTGSLSGSFHMPQVVARWDGKRIATPAGLRIDSTDGSADLQLDLSQPLLLTNAVIAGKLDGLQRGALALGRLDARLQFAPQATAPLRIDVRADKLTLQQVGIDSIVAAATGTTAAHQLQVTMQEAGQAQQWTMALSGGLHQLADAPAWVGDIREFALRGRLNGQLLAAAPLRIEPQRVALDDFTLVAQGSRLHVAHFLRQGQTVSSAGQLQQFPLAQALTLAGTAPALTTDLRLDGEWDVKLADTLSGRIGLRRTDGDIILRSSAPVALGLQKLEASATLQPAGIVMRLNAEGRQLGRIAVNATANAPSRAALGDETRVAGNASLDLPTLGWLGPLLSPGLLSEGRISSTVTLTGTVGAPQFAGRINGSGLRLYLGDNGIDLRQGVLESEFHGDTLMLNRLAFRSETGELSASGQVGLASAKPSAQIRMQADRYTLYNRSDRKLVLSGQAALDWQAAHGRIKGMLRADSGYVDIGTEDMPRLSDDVVIVGRGTKSPTPIAADIDLRLDLGEGVRVAGRGLDAAFAGQVQLQATPGSALRAQGSIRVAEGSSSTFSAYGRKLAIEQGALRFNGSLANPALDIVAMRRGTEVEAGVAVRGSVLAPRITLVSEPAVPDAEKLSWLVLGHGLDNAGNADMGALQSAAGALLSGGAAAGVQQQLATAFGFDEFRIGSTTQDNLQQRIVTLGKRMSSRLYLSYQQSLQATGSVLLLRYTLSPRLTVEAEAGTRSALSLLYNVAFD